MQTLIKLLLLALLAHQAVCAHQQQAHLITSYARKQSLIQLKCDAQGEEPITIEWFKNKLRLNVNELDPRYSIHYKAAKNELKSQLVIKNLQRSDSSIYECLAKNKAGKEIRTHELHVQEEPDSIQDLQATQISSRSATLVWTDPYDGRSAITSYQFQYKKVHEPAGLTDLDSASAADDQGALMKPGATHGLSLGATSLAGSVANVGVSASVSMSTDLDDWQTASRLDLPVRSAQAQNQTNPTPGGRSISIEMLEPFSKYVIRALARNAIGPSKFSQPMEFSTEEEAPEIAPSNIRAVAINSTSIQVSWDEIPKSKQLGRIQGYYIGYRVANQSASQSFLYKPNFMNDLLASGSQPGNQQLMLQAQGQHQEARLESSINDLRRDTAYEISVVAFNSHGSGPSSDYVLCKTNDLEPPMPVKIQIRRESNESIFIEWQRDPLDQNPVDDYVLYQEKNSASQEWLQVRLPGNQSQYKAPGLKCGTRYQFYIIAQNRMGKSAPSDVVSTSTSGSKPAVPSKTSLIKMVNSTCLQINLNSFQDSVCRIRTFTVRYRLEKLISQQASSLVSTSSGLAASHQALTGAQPGAQSASGSGSAAGAAGASGLANKQQSDEWITVRPRQAGASTSGPTRQLPFYHQLHSVSRQSGEQEDRMEYLCHLNPLAEYTIHVAAHNDVGRTEVTYSVLMSSDELRHSSLREMADLLTSLPNIFAYMPSVLVFMIAGLLLTLVCMLLFTGAAKYYQKFVIMHNQLRATRRAKRDERRRRKLNNLRHSQKLDLWTAEFEHDDEQDEQDCDDDDDDDDDHDADGMLGANNHLHADDDDDDQADCDELSSSSTSCSRGGFVANPARLNRRRAKQRPAYLQASAGHFLTNISNSAFDSSSLDTSGCGLSGGHKYTGSSCSHSTASTESIHRRFQCLNSKQYVKMNEYTVLPSISASLSPPGESIYGQASVGQPPQQQQPSAIQQQQQANANNIYYSTLRRSSMQTYLPQRSQQQQRANHNMSDIYGYYVAPRTGQLETTCSSVNSQTQQQQHQQQQQQHHHQKQQHEIFVPPQHPFGVVYSAPNIRRQPVFL